MMRWVKVWRAPEDDTGGWMMRAVERFIEVAMPDIETRSERDDILFLIEPEQAPMWTAVLRAFGHGWTAGYTECVSHEYNGSRDVEYPEDGVHLFADAEE